jgi:hypothetical protein
MNFLFYVISYVIFIIASTSIKFLQPSEFNYDDINQIEVMEIQAVSSDFQKYWRNGQTITRPYEAMDS